MAIAIRQWVIRGKWTTLVLFVLCLTPLSHAQLQNQSPIYHGKLLHQLPSHVDATAEGLSLFADFKHPTIEGRIPIYLINRSAEDLELNAQDGSIYTLLQFRNDNGQWQRAETQRYSWCGNSYFTLTLRPGYFIEREGYQARAGATSDVRFALYGQSVELVSNIGKGLVADNDVQNAALDRLSINTGSFQEVADIALSDKLPANIPRRFDDSRRTAIYRLASGQYDSVDSRRVLEQVLKEFPDYKHEVERALLKLP